MAKQYTIQKQKSYNGYKNVLFMMEKDSFNLRTWPENYKHVTNIVGKSLTTKAIRGHNGHAVKLYQGANGKVYEVFVGDHSAKEGV